MATIRDPRPERVLDLLRELDMRREMSDPGGTINVLEQLSEVFQAQGRLHHALDCADEILRWANDDDDPKCFPRGLRRLGLIHIEAGNLDYAIDYLNRASKIVATMTGVPVQHQAELFVQQGRAHWLNGAERSARARLRTALELVVDVDCDAAYLIGGLLKTPRGAVLAESAIESLKSL